MSFDIPYCQRCLKNGCRDCRAVEGGELCAFCEDSQPCPTAKREFAENVRASAQVPAAPKKKRAVQTSAAKPRAIAHGHTAPPTKSAVDVSAAPPGPDSTDKENEMAKKLCACGCGEPVGKRPYKNGHRPKEEKKPKVDARGGAYLRAA